MSGGREKIVIRVAEENAKSLIVPAETKGKVTNAEYLFHWRYAFRP